MTKINGFKVIGSTEVVIGKVVEFNEDDLEGRFKLVEYYVNQYDTYLHRTIESFDIDLTGSQQKKFLSFKENLGRFTRVSEVYVDQQVMEVLTT